MMYSKVAPRMPEIHDATSMPSLENISNSGVLKPNCLTNKAMVKPIPARQPTASICPQWTPFGRSLRRNLTESHEKDHADGLSEHQT